MRHDAAELAHRLARDAEAVCRHYLSNGRREGGYWLVGDVRNTPGRSMFVRLKGAESGKGAAGKWTDAARVNTAICSMSFVKVAALPISTTSPTKPAASLACHGQSRNLTQAARNDHHRPQPVRRNRHGGSSPCRSRLRAQS